MPVLIFSRQAERDLDEIFDYIARDSYVRAIAFLEVLHKAFIIRAEMPMAGKQEAFLRPGTLWFPTRNIFSTIACCPPVVAFVCCAFFTAHVSIAR